MTYWCDDMVEEYLEYLKNDESRIEVALKLFDYARGLLEVCHGWRSGEMLPGGIDPEDLVLEVFRRVASGKRKLNNRYPYEVQLKGMVRSLISKLFHTTDAKLQTIDLTEDDAGYLEVENAIGVGGTDSPFESNDFSRQFMEQVESHPMVKRDPDFGLVIIAYAEGAEGAAEAAKETGIPVKRVYEYNRHLKGILRDIQAQMN